MLDSRTLAKTVLKLMEKSDNEEFIDVFISYIKRNNLTGLLPQVVSHINRLGLHYDTRERVDIRSRYKLSKNDIKCIKDSIGAHEVFVVEHIDKSVLGGFSVTYNGYIYDASLKHNLLKLKTSLINTTL